MGLFNCVKKILRRRKLRQECLDEIVQLIYKNKLTFVECLLDGSIGHTPTIGEIIKNSSVIERLTNLKRDGRNYSLEISLNRQKNSYYLGKVINSDYEKELSFYRTKYEEKRKEMENKGFLVPAPGENVDDVCEKIKEKISKKFVLIPHVIEFFDLVRNYEQLSLWVEYYNSQCPYCGGSGEIVMPMDVYGLYGDTREKCSSCGGGGNVSLSKLQQYCEQAYTQMIDYGNKLLIENELGVFTLGLNARLEIAAYLKINVK